MHFTDLHVDGFGVWNDLSIDELPETLTLIFGRNEAGKTTLMQFIRTVLYGFSPNRRERYLPPVRSRLAGGSVYLASDRGNLEIQRHLDKRDRSDHLGEVAITTGDGTVGHQHDLDAVLAGVDESVFNNVFAVGLRELQELATLNDTAAADQLYKLTTGLDRVSLADVLRELNASRARLLSEDDRPSQITHMVAQRQQLQIEIHELAHRGNHWSRKVGERDGLKSQVAALEQSIQQAEQRGRLIEAALHVYPTWQERKTLNEQLAKFGPVANLNEDSLELLERIDRAVTKRRRRLHVYQEKLSGLRDQAKGLPINRKLLSQSARIEALGEHEPFIASLENQIERLDQEVVELDEDFRTRYEGLDLGQGIDWDKLPDLSTRTLTVLRAPAQAVRQHSAELADAKQEQRTCREEAAVVEQQLLAEVSRRGHETLPAALEEAGNNVSRLRRRVQLEERIDKMERTREELKEEIDELLDEQVLPLWKLAVVGIPFVLGVMLILLGIFFPGLLGIAWAVSLLGLGGLGVGVVMKIWLERRAGQELAECKEQLHRLRDQLQQARTEREKLDKELPTAGGPVDVRLADAEETVAQLEQLLPMETQLQEAKSKSEAAGRRATEFAIKLKEARNRWRGALRSVGLPMELTPKAVKELAQRSGNVAQVGRTLQQRQEELKQRKAELASIAARVRALASEVGVKLNGQPPRVQLQTLTAALSEQQQMVLQRRDLVHRYRQVRHRGQQISQSIDRLTQRRRTLLVEAGASDEGELRQLLVQQSRIKALRKDRQALTDRIAAALGNQFSEDEVGREIEGHSESALEQRWQELESRREKAKTQLAQIHQQYGRLAHELRSLAEDRRLDEAKLELACLDRQLDEAMHQWKVYSAATQVLESVRAIYETDRQPETLKEASGYLHQLTEGQYGRVWTPLDEDVLRVDNGEGESLPVEVLSRGTREAVFLSLRLALISSYAKRGANLPVVLDDVLVNFDADRAKAAAKVLRDFAKEGHQVLFFTCHDHIRKMFKSLRQEIRDLPSRDEIEEELIEVEVGNSDEPDEIEEETEVAEDEYAEDESEWDDNSEVLEEEDDFEKVVSEHDEEALTDKSDVPEEIIAQEESCFDWQSARALWIEDPEEAA